MFKKILLAIMIVGVLLPFALVALGVYFDIAAQNRATAFCDGLPLGQEINVEQFEEWVVQHQPSKIWGREGEDSLSFGDNFGAHYRPITLDEIKTSGIDNFLHSAGKSGMEVNIQASFYGNFPYSIYLCETRLENRRFATKQVVDGDNSGDDGWPLVIKAY
jgi:hypothetical protein